MLYNVFPNSPLNTVRITLNKFYKEIIHHATRVNYLSVNNSKIYFLPVYHDTEMNSQENKLYQ